MTSLPFNFPYHVIYSTAMTVPRLSLMQSVSIVVYICMPNAQANGALGHEQRTGAVGVGIESLNGQLIFSLLVPNLIVTSHYSQKKIHNVE